MKYKIIEISKDDEIEKIYEEMLEKKWDFTILKKEKTFSVLTKEQSIFEIDDVDKFINKYKENTFYKTIILDEDEDINKEDLELYFKYIKEYGRRMLKNIYGKRYVFGSVAVRSGNKIITTLRGKKDLKDYTIIDKVDHNKHIVYVRGNKATLNAPLLDYLFKNKKVKVIVHINHEYDKRLLNYDYAFPGTVRDSIRNNETSFNIKYHGLIYLFDKEGNLL